MHRMAPVHCAAREVATFLIVIMLGVVALGIPSGAQAATEAPGHWKAEWPRTDFSKHSVPLGEIRDVIRKDGIPAIDLPKFGTAKQAAGLGLADKEPVVSIAINGDARAYPLRMLTWHEIVNDKVGGVPVSVTFCPLCNSAIVFDRRLGGRVLDFGTTGKLRNSDLVMYDRQTQSWWQQFLGKGLVGELSGKELKMLPMRMESFAKFRKRHPDGKVLIPGNSSLRPYGRNPYRGYDSSSRPFLYPGALPKGIPPLERVVVVGKEAWAFSLLRKVKKVEAGDIVITWEAGQASALDAGFIKDGKDVGNVVVQRRTKDGKLVDAVHDVSFAFAFHAFYPKGKIHVAE
ncbi:MAG: DUF3179 domain-containing protein [Pseudomonadota bacterium]